MAMRMPLGTRWSIKSAMTRDAAIKAAGVVAVDVGLMPWQCLALGLAKMAKKRWVARLDRNVAEAATAGIAVGAHRTPALITAGQG